MNRYIVLLIILFLTPVLPVITDNVQASQSSGYDTINGVLSLDSVPINGTVKATSMETGISSEVLTDSNGEFTINIADLGSNDGDLIRLEGWFYDSQGNNRYITTCKVYWSEQINATLNLPANEFYLGWTYINNNGTNVDWYTHYGDVDVEGNLASATNHLRVNGRNTNVTLKLMYNIHDEFRVPCDRLLAYDFTFEFLVQEYPLLLSYSDDATNTTSRGGNWCEFHNASSPPLNLDPDLEITIPAPSGNRFVQISRSYNVIGTVYGNATYYWAAFDNANGSFINWIEDVSMERNEIYVADPNCNQQQEGCATPNLTITWIP